MRSRQGPAAAGAAPDDGLLEEPGRGGRHPAGPDPVTSPAGCMHEGPSMIPQHILDDLGPDDRVAVLVRDGELHFLVHAATAPASEVRAYADRDGSEVLATHLRDKK